MDEDFREQYGIKYIRGCEIVDFIGVDGNGFIYVYCIITLLFDQGDQLMKFLDLDLKIEKIK